ncbi:DegT/DnrJ/EryC1/StrS family aminotransferase [Flavitalea sp. BT771]|uniref:DegT/DnrJ/EryC1/StrS family aminotransferase n=1 Tax=Flavitalea sp. BT771 TaxID=3063329 RepID=UPI0026E138F8|nr:DegT/DnrJ/EryC1/StrS family aminotransferase [Flavitalea sp. BT771]MDO6429402.1 DegT/DnrJ/EryC1/StrS family aminotransferase [Flavitalea sp. BT771]MDV6218470.1 DegT/DnrJ/EryC1/StrS family aminotransferase [Flavitalea sp. BT771]
MNIPFSPPFIDEAVLKEVTETLRSGWITSGPRVKELESLMRTYTGMPECICVNSWTSGAQLVLKWWGVGPGDEVIIPAYTYAATALVVLRTGATPVMVDVDEDFVMDPLMLRRVVTTRTKVIIPVDFAGLPCDYVSIRNMLHESTIRALFVPANSRQEQLGRPLLLADAAHSLGALYHDGPAGLQADIAVYSFHAVKNVTTAEGGVIGLSLPPPYDNSELYRWMKLNSLNGQTKDAYEKKQGDQWRYDIVSEGMKINMPDICAAVGVAQLRKYGTDLLPRRKKIAELYTEALGTDSWARMPTLRTADKESSYHIFPLRISNITEFQRDAMIDFIYKKGVSVNVHFIPLPMLTLFHNKGYRVSDFPVSYANFATEISLPIYPQLSDAEVEYIVYAAKQAYYNIIQCDVCSTS